MLEILPGVLRQNPFVLSHRQPLHIVWQTHPLFLRFSDEGRKNIGSNEQKPRPDKLQDLNRPGTHGGNAVVADRYAAKEIRGPSAEIGREEGRSQV
jgi:hypothetical protein